MLPTRALNNIDKYIQTMCSINNLSILLLHFHICLCTHMGHMYFHTGKNMKHQWVSFNKQLFFDSFIIVFIVSIFSILYSRRFIIFNAKRVETERFDVRPPSLMFAAWSHHVDKYLKYFFSRQQSIFAFLAFSIRSSE